MGASRSIPTSRVVESKNQQSPAHFERERHAIECRGILLREACVKHVVRLVGGVGVVGAPLDTSLLVQYDRRRSGLFRKLATGCCVDCECWLSKEASGK